MPSEQTALRADDVLSTLGGLTDAQKIEMLRTMRGGTPTAVPGITTAMLQALHLDPPLPGRSREHAYTSMCGWLHALKKQDILSGVIKGCILLEVRTHDLWKVSEGEHTSFESFARNEAGVGASHASKLCLIAEILINEFGVPLEDLTQARSVEALYVVSQRHKIALREAGPAGRSERRDQLQGTVSEMVGAAHVMPVEELQRHMDVNNLPGSGACRHLRTTRLCSVTGEVDPTGCDECRGRLEVLDHPPF